MGQFFTTARIGNHGRGRNQNRPAPRECEQQEKCPIVNDTLTIRRLTIYDCTRIFLKSSTVNMFHRRYRHRYLIGLAIAVAIAPRLTFHLTCEADRDCDSDSDTERYFSDVQCRHTYDLLRRCQLSVNPRARW
jgi:hypothetical protein